MGETRKKKRWRPEEIAAVMRRVLVEKIEVSAVCEEAGCCPSQVYRWQKQLFDGAAVVFQRANGSADKQVKVAEAKTSKLEAKLRRKDEAFAERDRKLEKARKRRAEARARERAEPDVRVKEAVPA